MKIITDYFASPPTNHKKCNSSDKFAEKIDPACNSITTLEDDTYYPTRKIKIRLADPNVPDSYVCEVYDTSVEEEIVSTLSNEPEKNCAFNILMAGKGRESKKRTRPNLVADGSRTDSSDDETLIFVKKKLKIATAEKAVTSCGKIGNEEIKKKTASSHNEETKNIGNNQLKRRSIRKKAPFKNFQSMTSIEDNISLIDIQSKNALSCNPIATEGVSIEKNQVNLRSKSLKKKASIEKYFMSSNKSVSKTGNNSKSLKDGVYRKGNMSQSTIKCNEELSNLKNNECLVVLEKLSIPIMFRKTSIKPPIDPETFKARQEFLQKGLPKVLLKKLSKEKFEEKDVQFFPLISHILRSCDNLLWKKRKINLALNSVDCQYSPELCWKPCINSQISMTNLINKIKRASNVKTHLKNLATIHKNVETTRLFDVLTEINESHSNNQISTIWSNKYKLKSSDFLSNEQTIAKLKKWLLSWKKYGENIKSISKKSCGESSDDFVSSDDDEKQSNAPVTACLLQGPISSGKTALVQALAAELDFHILEVNCSSKRSGKKMLADLQEATKSHKILQEANGNVGTSLKGEKMAIIVVEEADIIFEDHDDGFVFGLQTLINSARRPVLLLTSEPTISHLERFRYSQTLQLKLVRPQLTTSCAFLELVALVEGAIVPRLAVCKMLSLNNCDLRQSLLQLQFWVQHGSHNSIWPIINNQLLTTGRMWWQSHQLLFKSNLCHSDPNTLEKSEEKIINESNEESVKKTLCQVQSKLTSNYFENLSLCDLLQGKAVSFNTEITNFDVKIKDSSCLSANLLLENTKQNMFHNEVIEEILQRNLSLIKSDKSTLNLHDIPVKDKRWLTSQTKASDELNQVVPNRYSNIARYCDYLPSLRSICRAEQKREVDNTKRRNRFYHYLKNLGGSPTPANLNINCSVLFQEM